MSSVQRLDRLLILLASGPNASVRRTAAKQLGSLAAQRVQHGTEHGEWRGIDGEWTEVAMLLEKVLSYLTHKSWDTRIAASQAVESICAAVGIWDPSTVKLEPDPGAAPVPSLLDALNLTDVLNHAGILAAFSSGSVPDSSGAANRVKHEADDAADQGAKLSASEKMALKRKRKAEEKQGGRAAKLRATDSGGPAPILHPGGSNGTASEPVVIAHKATTGGEVKAQESQNEVLEWEVKPGEWPFSRFADHLAHDLLDPAWEARHGAAVGLRELLRYQAIGAGGLSRANRAQWVESLASTLLTLLARDRFVDFVGDHVSAPVREAAAQALSLLLRHAEGHIVQRVGSALLQLVYQLDVAVYAWQARHSGLLGIQHLMAISASTVRNAPPDSTFTLDAVLDVALLGLKDPDDDVRAASASALLPLVNDLAQLPGKRVTLLTTALWTCLEDLGDDLSSSVSTVMDLLSRLISLSNVLKIVQQDTEHHINRRVPLIFPFFRFTITAVRRAVVSVLDVFLNLDGQTAAWLDGRALRLLFQNALLEEQDDIRSQSLTSWITATSLLETSRLIEVASPLLVDWFKMASTPIGVPMSTELFWKAKGSPSGHNVDKPILVQDLAIVSLDHIVAGRVAAISALAFLLKQWSVAAQDIWFKPLLLTSLTAPSMQQRFVAAGVIAQWVALCGASAPSTPLRDDLLTTLLALLETPPRVSYAETWAAFDALYNDSQKLAKALILPSAQALPPRDAFRPEHAIALADQIYNTSVAMLEISKKPAAEELHRRVGASLSLFQQMKQRADVQIYAAIARAVVAFGKLPAKLTPIIRSLMDSIKMESNRQLQQLSADSLALFIQKCCDAANEGKPNPSDKVIKNICLFMCQDTSQVATYAAKKHLQDEILLLHQTESAPEANGQSKFASQPAKPVLSVFARGSEAALASVAVLFGDALFEGLPKLRESLLDPISVAYSIDVTVGDDMLRQSDAQGQALLDSLTVISAMAPHLSQKPREALLGAFGSLSCALRSSFSVVRSAVASCYAAVCDADPVVFLQRAVVEVLPFAADSTNVTNRRGVIELIARLVARLDMRILPYIIFFVVPVLGRMTDADEQIRLLATNTFASLIKLVPLEAGLPDPEGFPPELLEKREHERAFLSQLLDGNRVEEYELPIEVKAELRKYQREGVSWLAFLAKYQLHGILCDDMGLGKTLQAICILASKHEERRERFKATASPDAAHTPSLVVCPPTLTGHWRHEILTFVNNLRPLLYIGDKTARTRLRSRFKDVDVVITSYEVVRNDIDALRQQDWLYCILDEGHIIKSAKTKLTQAVKMLRSHHRVILSGTPIQNNVLELWSLFDFLMPGFLGTEKVFNERFSKPILGSRDAKSSSKAQSAGALALEALHKQVLPFLLRRLKEDVLDDLPPKIIQDYYCDLSPLQRELYEAFSNAETGEVKSDLQNGEGKAAGQHVFQSLQYLRQLVNHPRLVLKADNPHHQEIMIELKATKPGDLSNSPKLQALKQILLDCGIGAEDQKGALDDAAAAQHRVLVFCQMRQMLDLVEHELLRANMPSVSYMRLDGSTPAAQRHGVVQAFNADPSIDVLLLTTHVGGLGLNLTSADTVVFVEHDWNPMKDLQAMDRAHRIGQKRVVNVYRLITRNTLEEKIMGLQRFKLNIASSVVTQQNASLSTMGTDQVLDLFSLSSAEEEKKKPDEDKPMSQKAVLASLDALADEEVDDTGMAFIS